MLSNHSLKSSQSFIRTAKKPRQRPAVQALAGQKLVQLRGESKAKKGRLGNDKQQDSIRV